MEIISKYDFARGEFDLADEAFKQSGLAAAVWADNTEKIAGIKREGEVFEDVMALVFERKFISC